MSTTARRSRGSVLFVVGALLAAVVSGLMIARIATRDPSAAAIEQAEARYLPGFHFGAASSDQEKIDATIRRMLTAMQAGDVATVRTLSCGEFAQAFAGPEPQIGDAMRQAYTAVSFAVAAVENIRVYGDDARADAIEIATQRDTGKKNRSVEQFVLQRHGYGWQVCDSH
ncbi:hypothetical protein [Speluncibacter jeojiensis]|uniref:DUF4878 domain-containing protein n=1 Tax=Speluncibacter jeojiensis TaxID=2710754 RepID=A0A9X4REW3_9ACTN|nr:hypothetical protein [Corynebacteriales bacterium D3-21]